MSRRRSTLVATAALVAMLVLLGLLAGRPWLADDAGNGAPAEPQLALRLEFDLVARAKAADASPAPQPPARRRKGQPPDLALRADTRLANAPDLDSASAEETAGANPGDPQPLPANLPRGPLRLDTLGKARDLGEAAELFASRSWVPAPPPPPPPPPPVPEVPTAPPLPFRYLGRLDDGSGKVTYFLLRGTAQLNVHVGEQFDPQYRLDSVQAGVMHFTYLPLQTRQTLSTGTSP